MKTLFFDNESGDLFITKKETLIPEVGQYFWFKNERYEISNYSIDLDEDIINIYGGKE